MKSSFALDETLFDKKMNLRNVSKRQILLFVFLAVLCQIHWTEATGKFSIFSICLSFLVFGPLVHYAFPYNAFS